MTAAGKVEVKEEFLIPQQALSERCHIDYMQLHASACLFDHSGRCMQLHFYAPNVLNIAN